jgi:hypothetical protein
MQTLSPVYSQEKEFSIVDRRGDGIPYVNVYGKNFNFGAISDEEGKVLIPLSNLKEAGVLRLSCIGYEEKLISVDSLLALQPPAIPLDKTSYALEEVEVVSERLKYRKRKAGVRVLFDWYQLGFAIEPDKRGREIGVVMKNGEKCYIETVAMDINYVSHDTMFYEMNIYDFAAGQVGPPIIDERIFFRIPKSEIKKNFRIELSDRNIKVEDDFFVSIEAITAPDSGKDYITIFNASTGKKEWCLVKKKNGNWTQEEDMAISIFSELRCVKK